jgi:Uma2 family endonuclease
MPTLATDLMTAEEFAALPQPVDGSLQELIRGKVIQMPPVQGRHGFVVTNIATLLNVFTMKPRKGWVVVESGVILERDPDTVRGPDVSFYSIARHPGPPDRYFEIPPDLAVEVLSPDDRRSKVREKIREYISKGVKLFWLVDPEAKTVTVYRGSLRGAEYDESETLDGGDILPGFTCPITDLFD